MTILQRMGKNSQQVGRVGRVLAALTMQPLIAGGVFQGGATLAGVQQRQQPPSAALLPNPRLSSEVHVQVLGQF